VQSDLRWPSSRLIAGVRFTVEGAGVAPLETADRSVPPWNRRLSLSHQVWPKAPQREAEDEPRPSAKAERLGTHDASVPCRALTRALTWCNRRELLLLLAVGLHPAGALLRRLAAPDAAEDRTRDRNDARPSCAVDFRCPAGAARLLPLLDPFTSRPGAYIAFTTRSGTSRIA